MRSTTSSAPCSTRCRALTLVPGLGMFGHGRTLKDAQIASDVGEMWIEAVRGAEAVGRFHPLSKADLFPLEYWSLEQAKLASNKPKPLTGQVVLITGGAGASVRRPQSCSPTMAPTPSLSISMPKRPPTRARRPATIRSASPPTSPTRTGARRLRQSGRRVRRRRHPGLQCRGRLGRPIGELDDALLRKSFELNFFAHQSVAQNAVRIMLEQGTGGCLCSTPPSRRSTRARVRRLRRAEGSDAVPVRQYALDYGAYGIRSNAVNADRIRSGLLTDAMIASRSGARGVSEKDYMSGNLLGQEVTAQDVAQAFLHHALAERTTADVTTVDGGNIAAALR